LTIDVSPFLIAAVLLAVFSSPTHGQICTGDWAQHDRLLRQYKLQWNESPVAIGVTHDGWIVELWASGPEADDSTWTLVMVKANGCAKPVLSGYGWEALKKGSKT
jgi:hypothetical protein